ncbi:uncharacterized protein K444DRAFT_395090 [Hyaloscypha bicolor E]|uniref:Uncharacterized protein n=1 Tax=Hyaloscypha bicolor E TaxID=1095630 RepID=A0A2J6TC57_9HELO|nr:uncharacterized protein K444DRAFT_395090 [Hyaloscypha bicolor E]PMD60552.1 hypothetical protein K444DRAFT_395090 [Hyaloscypha bicolor E]
MSADLLARIERNLCKMGEELWNINGPDNIINKRSLQATANLLQRVPSNKALPKQQATKVKHLVRFAFRKNSHQELPERGKEGKEGRYRKLRKLDCNTLKLYGLSYTTEEIIKLVYTARRLLIRKRKYDIIILPNEAAQAPTEKETNITEDDNKTKPE